MKNFTLIFILLIFVLVTCKEEQLPKIEINYKIDLELTLNDINGSSANITCNLINTENFNIDDYGLCWNISGNPTTNDYINKSNSLGDTIFSKSMTDLEPETDYYVKGFLTINGTTIYSDQIKISTSNGLPSLTTTAISEITAISATSGGVISDDNGFEITARGICWSTTSNPTISDNKTIDGSGTGSFTSNITGLSVSTTYFIRSYATNATGTVYGNEISFTTEDGLPIGLTTTAISDITATTATSGGNISDDGSFNITYRGVCWSKTTNPTISDNYTLDGTGVGSYTSYITDLEINTTYYLRAYATNVNGTVYGNEVSFSTIGTIIDYDGNEYKIVKINNQLWMAENLKTTHYADGTEINLVESNTNWEALTENDIAYCYYDNSSSNGESYGALYTWTAAMNAASSSNTNPSSIQGACPEGWHLPSDAEWIELINYIINDGHSGSEGEALKSVNGWYNNGQGTDNYGFTALPAGVRDVVFGDLLMASNFWSSTEYDTMYALKISLSYLSDTVNHNYWSKTVGCSIRCIKD